jgi:hypothetical protein
LHEALEVGPGKIIVDALNAEPKTLAQECREAGVKLGRHCYRPVLISENIMETHDGARYGLVGGGLRRLNPKPNKHERKAARQG